MTKSNKEESLLWIERGMALREQGRSEEAIQAFDEVIKFEPVDADMWLNKGRVLMLLERSEEAIQAFDEVIKFEPENDDAWLNKGLILMFLERYEEAIQTFDKKLLIHPFSSDISSVLGGKGKSLESLGRHEEAKQVYTKVKSIQKSDLLVEKGLTLWKQGRMEDAIRLFKSAVLHFPENAATWLKLGAAFNTLGQKKESYDAYVKAIKIYPPFGDAIPGIKADILANEGQYDEALNYYEEAIQLNPKNPIPWHGKGITLQKMGRTEEANEAFAKENAIR